MTLIVEYVKNAEILDAEGTKLKALIKYKNLPERETTLSIESDDKEEVDLLHEIAEGKYGEVTPYVTNTTIEEVQASIVIAKRNKLLLQSDWTQLGDIPAATKEKWAAYRQALRDITKQEGFPLTVVFPEQP
jgi:Phage tail assembly chaperone protein